MNVPFRKKMNRPIQIGACSACGGKVSSEAKACPHCGQPSPFQSDEPVASPDEANNRQKLKTGIPYTALVEEVWMPVEGYDASFSVSSLGNVRSETRSIPHRRLGQAVHKGKPIVPTTKKSKSNKYAIVSFTKEGKGRTFQVHQLVAKTFLTNEKNLPHVNHIDGNGLNNRLDNLEWISPRDNVTHAYQSGLRRSMRGEMSSSAKLTEKQVREIKKYLEEGAFSQRKLAEIYQVVPMVITQIKLRKTWKHVS
jgi:hypothetical protein